MERRGCAGTARLDGLDLVEGLRELTMEVFLGSHSPVEVEVGAEHVVEASWVDEVLLL